MLSLHSIKFHLDYPPELTTRTQRCPERLTIEEPIFVDPCGTKEPTSNPFLHLLHIFKSIDEVSVSGLGNNYKCFLVPTSSKFLIRSLEMDVGSGNPSSFLDSVDLGRLQELRFACLSEDQVDILKAICINSTNLHTLFLDFSRMGGMGDEPGLHFIEWDKGDIFCGPHLSFVKVEITLSQGLERFNSMMSNTLQRLLLAMRQAVQKVALSIHLNFYGNKGLFEEFDWHGIRHKLRNMQNLERVCFRVPKECMVNRVTSEELYDMVRLEVLPLQDSIEVEIDI
ncbi:hypothetical protein NLI96_g8600 [Meripilus lineatus]|uniref:Uncharacterized protein n=1 Tax=Meripilus lineatus TaxID=2056292 RepID=A0AAD5UXB0_9APHY|nr:hypothetical protein NLI96_g8600 [Physisporinus lineatus]